MAGLQLAVIADDLTGAGDTGVQFARLGLRTVVTLGAEALPDADAVVIDTESRWNAPHEAREKVRRAAAALKAAGVPHIYKKIDSTMRGNVGAEAEGLLEGLGADTVVVCPAFPPSGRAVRDGVLSVGGAPLAETEFASVPGLSRVATIMARQTELLVAEVGAVSARAYTHFIKEVISEGARLVAADATTEDDLRNLAQGIIAAGAAPCGSAGLAAAWALELGLVRPGAQPVLAPPPPSDRPVLVMAGSVSATTRAQVRRAEESGLAVVIPAPVDPLLDGYGYNFVFNKLCFAVAGGHSPIIVTSGPVSDDPGVRAQVAARLGGLAALLVQQWRFAGYFLTGGDTAVAVCQALEARGLEIGAEVQRGVPWSRLVGGAADGAYVVTKAGGFGDENAIADSIRFLKGARCVGRETCTAGS